MKILVIPSWYPSCENPLNGVFFREQVEALKEIGVDITVLNISFKPITSILSCIGKCGLNVATENGIKIYRYNGINYFPKMYGLYIKYYQSKLKKYINQIEKEVGKFDLIHIHSAFDAGIAYGNMNFKIPYILTEHSSRYHRNKINNMEDKMLYNTLTKSKMVIAVGLGLKDKIQKYDKGKEVIVIPNSVSIDTNVKVKNKTTRFRFFSLAFLNTYKGMDILINAFNLNKDVFKEVELLIGGDGPERQKLESLVNDLNLNNNIEFLGALDRKKVAENMNNCDAFVLASRVETFGIVFLEAMSFGKPVIATNTGGPNTFINKECGLVVDIDDERQLADAMKNLYLNISTYNSEKIINYIEDNFSKKIVAKKVEKIYKEVLGDIYD